MEVLYRDTVYRRSILHPSLAVSSSGLVLNIADRKQVVLNPKKENRYLALTSPDTHKTVHLHRLVAEAWVINPDPDLFLVVNHIDGDKHNPDSSNLEYTSYRGNLLHAYAIGLRTEMKTLQLLDKKLELWSTARGLNSVSKTVGISPAQLSYHLKTAGWYENENFIVRLADLEERISPSRIIVSSVYAKEISTGKVFAANSVSGLSGITSIPKSNIKRAIKKGKEYSTKGFLISLDGEFPSVWKTNHRTKIPFSLVSVSGKTVTVNSDREAEKVTGINAKRIARMKKEGNSFKGWSIINN